MGRWLAAIALLAGALAAGGIAFLNGGGPIPIRVTPNRTLALPLGTALALAFASGAALIAVIALGAALARATRRWRRRRQASRERAAAGRERVQAERLLVGGDADRARSRLTDAVAAHAGDERLLELLAGASERTGDLAGAIAAVEDARARRPDSPVLARRLGALYAAAERWDDALALESELARALGVHGDAAERERLCGLRFEAAAADPDASRGTRRLLALAREHPGFAAAWATAGDRLRDGGQPARARRVYERGARARPAGVLLDRLAALDDSAGHPERTVRTLEHLRRLHSRDPALVAALVRRHLRADAVDRAEAALAAWSADGAAAPAIEVLRGECARRRGRSEDAIAHLERAAAEHLEPRIFRCRGCHATSPDWRARCAACGRWDALEHASDAIEGDASAALMPVPSRNPSGNHCVTESPG